MSDKTNDLKDDLEDMIGDVKEGAKKVAAKAEEFGREAKEKASEFAKEAKEKAGEFTDEAKEKAAEFAEDAKKVLSDGKNVAIIAHLYVIGWVIALVMNNTNRSDLGTFYIKQTLGIFIISFLAIIPMLTYIIGAICLLLWIMSLVGALSGEKKPILFIGEQFQKWFNFV